MEGGRSGLLVLIRHHDSTRPLRLGRPRVQSNGIAGAEGLLVLARTPARTAVAAIRHNGHVPEPLRIRQPSALRAYIGGFGVFWCGIVAVGFLGLVPRPEALIPLGMLAFGGSLTYRMFRLEAVADDGGLQEWVART